MSFFFFFYTIFYIFSFPSAQMGNKARFVKRFVELRLYAILKDHEGV